MYFLITLLIQRSRNVIKVENDAVIHVGDFAFMKAVWLIWPVILTIDWWDTNEYAHDMIMFAVFDNKPVVHFIEPIH